MPAVRAESFSFDESTEKDCRVRGQREVPQRVRQEMRVLV